MSLKRLLLILGTLCVLLACAPAGLSQQTQVTGQVLDPRGFPWQAGTGNFVIQCTGNSQPYINGSPVSRNIPLVRLDGTGSFSQALWDTSFITDVNGQTLSCQWQANFLDNCGIATFSVLLTGITGASVNVTSQISAASVDLSAQCTPPGTVDSVTLGNLPPLFTVANTGTAINPVFTFTLDNAAAGTVYGNPGGSSAPPSFNALSAYGGLVSSVNGTLNEIIASPTTGAVVLSFPTTVQMPGSLETVDAITSDSGDITAGNRLLAIGNIQTTTGQYIVPSNRSYGFNGGSQIFEDSVTFAIHFKLNGGSDAPIVAQTATFSGISTNNCLETNGSSTVVGSGSPCAVGASAVQALIITTGICTVTGGAETTCSMGPFTWPTAFANSSYAISCSTPRPTGSGSNPGIYPIYWASKTASQFSLVMQAGSASAAGNNTVSEIDCVGVHP